MDCVAVAVMVMIVTADVAVVEVIMMYHMGGPLNDTSIINMMQKLFSQQKQP